MARPKKQKSRFIIWLEFIGFYLIYAVMICLPLKAACWLGRGLFFGMYWIDGRHRKRTVQHILHSGITTDVRAAKAMAWRSFEQFSRLLIEVIKARQLYKPELVAVVGDPEGCRFVMPPPGESAPQVMVASAHYGNWELAGSAIAEKACRPMISLMRAFDNPLIGKLILKHRTGSLHTMVDKRSGVRPLLRALGQGDNLAILIDQHAGGGEGVECLFFGHPAKVHKTPALLHLKTGIPIVPEVTRRVHGDEFKFELVFGAPIRYAPTGDKQHDVQAITQLCISALEELIRQEPEQWLWTPRHWMDINRGN